MKILAASVLLLLLAGCATAPVDDSAETHTIAPLPTPTSEPDAAVPEIVDSGPTAAAEGSAEPLPDGSVRYVVAEGDVGGVICDRFGLAWQQLQFEDGRSGVSCYASVFPGDVLNLSSARAGDVPE